MKKLILLTASALLILSCDAPPKPGTVNAVVNCVKKNSDQKSIISEEIIKNQCVKEHQKYKPYVYKRGNRAALVRIKNGYSFTNYQIKNPFDDFMVSGIETYVTFYDGNGKKYMQSVMTENLWVAPKELVKMGDINFYFDNTIDVFPSKYCNRIEVKEKKQKDCMEWGIHGWKVLEIKMK